jgi:hypothetical protein
MEVVASQAVRFAGEAVIYRRAASSGDFDWSMTVVNTDA